MAEPRPKLAAVESPASKPSQKPAAGRTAAAPEKPQRSRLPLLLGVALAIALLGALYQGQQLAQVEARATALSEQVIGLEAQLSAAEMQISTYELQRTQIRDAVSDLSERVLVLGELVGSDAPLGEPTPAP